MKTYTHDQLIANPPNFVKSLDIWRRVLETHDFRGRNVVYGFDFPGLAIHYKNAERKYGANFSHSTHSKPAEEAVSASIIRLVTPQQSAEMDVFALRKKLERLKATVTRKQVILARLETLREELLAVGEGPRARRVAGQIRRQKRELANAQIELDIFVNEARKALEVA